MLVQSRQEGPQRCAVLQLSQVPLLLAGLHQLPALHAAFELLQMHAPSLHTFTDVLFKHDTLQVPQKALSVIRS